MQPGILSAAPSKALTEDFARYEFKYILNLAQRQAIEAEIGNFMGMGDHIVEALDDQYRAISTTRLGEMISDGTYYLSCWMTMAQIKKMRAKKVIFSNLE